jgi:type II secretory pathway component PulM
MTHESPHDHSADAVHEGRPVEAQYVRQGRGGKRILMVLLGALAMVAIAFAVIWLASAGRLSQTNANDGDQPVDAAAFQGEGGREIPTADAPTTATGEPTAPPTGEAPNVNAPTVAAQPSTPAEDQ